MKQKKYLEKKMNKYEKHANKTSTYGHDIQ